MAEEGLTISRKMPMIQNDTYSIIITRDPIDVLRMADFKNIQSCHTPPSLGGASEYYKCAVAEAHGHGAVAYVVDTEDLLLKTDTDNIEEAQNIIQDGEIFDDDMRPEVRVLVLRLFLVFVSVK